MQHYANKFADDAGRMDMVTIRQMLINLGMYAVPVLFLLADLIGAVCLVNGFLSLRRKRRRQARELRYERQCYRIASQYAGTVQVFLRKKDLELLYAAGDINKMLGITLEEIRADVTGFFRLMEKEQAKSLKRQFEEWDHSGVIRQEFYCKERGSWQELCLAESEDGQCLLAVLRDITGEKEQMNQLERQLEDAMSASRYKSTFLSRMSHEIRTPMNGIIGMLSLARSRGREGAPIDSYLDKAETLSQHLLSLINDVLDMSRIEAGKIELEEKPFDLIALGEKLQNMFQKSAQAKGLGFRLEFLECDERYLIGDELRISQVLINFLSNSVKFTAKGEVAVTFRQMMSRDGIVDLMVRVHDTGIGMTPEFINRIFRPFEQESTQITKNYGGSGLGMAITDQIVRLMGGEIFVESMPEKGSDFTVYLHLPVAEGLMEGQAGRAEITPEDCTYTFAGKRILLAEDNEINAEIAVSVLGEQEGAIVETAGNGQEAVDRFCANPPGYYDFILMDIQMPVLDGRSATKKIRETDRSDAGQIPIFALSADAFTEDVRLSAEVGMNGHFSKPIDFEALRREIGIFFHERDSQ